MKTCKYFRADTIYSRATMFVVVGMLIVAAACARATDTSTPPGPTPTPAEETATPIPELSKTPTPEPSETPTVEPSDTPTPEPSPTATKELPEYTPPMMMVNDHDFLSSLMPIPRSAQLYTMISIVLQSFVRSYEAQDNGEIWANIIYFGPKEDNFYFNVSEPNDLRQAKIIFLPEVVQLSQVTTEVYGNEVTYFDGTDRLNSSSIEEWLQNAVDNNTPIITGLLLAQHGNEDDPTGYGATIMDNMLCVDNELGNNFDGGMYSVDAETCDFMKENVKLFLSARESIDTESMVRSELFDQGDEAPVYNREFIITYIIILPE